MPSSILPRWLTRPFAPHQLAPARAQGGPEIGPRPQDRAPALVNALRNQRGQVLLPRFRYANYEALFVATKAYFAASEATLTACDPCAVRESGFARIDAARVRLFVRWQLVPEHPLRKPLDDFRFFCAELARHALAEIALGVGMAPGALVELADFAAGSIERPSENIIRLFQYDPPLQRGAAQLTLTEAHRDIGLLAIGFRSAPGLQSYTEAHGWLALEAQLPCDVPLMMTGRSLALLTRGAIPSCQHRVMAGSRSRLSWVYHLRLREDALLDMQRLASPLLEPLFDELVGMTGGALTQKIACASHNVNAGGPLPERHHKPFDQQILERAATRRRLRHTDGWVAPHRAQP